jgi:hypothetical protein
MQENTTTSVESTAASGTTITDNWTLRDDSLASTSTVSSALSQPSETTRSHYSFRVEDDGEPASVELELPTSMAEESATTAESPQSVNSEFPITYYVHGQEAPIPFSLTNEAHIVIGSQENQTPITIPPPGNSPALRHIRVTPSSRDSPEVQTLVHAALNRIRETASATPGGAFFEDDINDIEQVLSLASSLRDPRRGTASEDDATASLMSRLNQVRRPRSPTPVIRRSRTPITYNVPQNVIPHPATLPTSVLPLLLEGDDWHPNRMLPSDAAPVDSEGKEELGLAWYSLYFQYRDTFRAQLSLCLISRHDLLTRLLLSDSNVTSDVTTSRVLFPSKADDKYLQHTYAW